MIKQFNFFFKAQFKQKRSKSLIQNKGFTLIELLVAMIIATLVITPLLGFMIDILNTDRKEQAKVNSEQEIQAALDYISQDLQQAVYIYDAKGIKAIKDQLPENTATDKVPVLVFWKRQFDKDAINVTVGGTNRGSNDTFVYSLVAYYLIKNTSSASNTWSDQFRIGRFEVKDGVRNPDRPTQFIKNADRGFALFDLIGARGKLEQKMNSWRKNASEDYNNQIFTLIDYIDKTPSSANTSLRTVNCTDATVFPERAVGNATGDERTIKEEKIAALRVPAFETSNVNRYSTTTDMDLQNSSSFYACIDSQKNIAKVFIRGNALARINNRNNTYSANNSSFFPQASIQVEAKGRLGIE